MEDHRQKDNGEDKIKTDVVYQQECLKCHGQRKTQLETLSNMQEQRSLMQNKVSRKG